MSSSSAHGSSLRLEMLHKEHEGLDKFGLLEKLVDLGHAAVSLRGSVSEVSSVSGLSLLDHSRFLGLVVVDGKAGTPQNLLGVAGDLLLNKAGELGSLEADEGVLDPVGFLRIHLKSHLLDGAGMGEPLE